MVFTSIIYLKETCGFVIIVKSDNVNQRRETIEQDLEG